MSPSAFHELSCCTLRELDYRVRQKKKNEYESKAIIYRLKCSGVELSIVYNHSLCWCDDQKTEKLPIHTASVSLNVVKQGLAHREGCCAQDLCRAEKKLISSTSTAWHGTAWRGRGAFYAQTRFMLCNPCVMDHCGGISCHLQSAASLIDAVIATVPPL